MNDTVQKWEYKTLDISGAVWDIEGRMNSWGNKGWELVSVDTVPAINVVNCHHTTAYFKRPL